jgi:hypothetical protein
MNEAQLIKAIKTLVEKGDKARDKAEQYYSAAGLHLKTLREESPNKAAWEKLIKSRAEQKWLQRIVSLTNAVSLGFNDGDPATCIFTSYALNDVLQRLGYSSYPLRVEAKVRPDDKKLISTILGSRQNGFLREAAKPDMWRGHLVVAIEDIWLLDATLDQANKTEWPSSVRVGPVAVRLNNAFWNEQQIIIKMNKTEIRYFLYPKQVGFAHVQDARPCHWRPLSNMIMTALERLHDTHPHITSNGRSQRGDDPIL